MDLPGIYENIIGSLHYAHGNILANILTNKDCGISPNIELLSQNCIEHYSERSLDDAQVASSIAKGIEYAIQQKVDSILILAGVSVHHHKLFKSINRALENKIIIITAASIRDYTRISYPSAYGNTICISAHDERRNLYEYSPKGREIEFISPGKSIKCSDGGNIAGTDVAAVIFTGICANIYEFLRKNDNYGKIGCYEMKHFLRNFTSSSGVHSSDIGFGCIDLNKLFRISSKKHRSSLFKAMNLSPDDSNHYLNTNNVDVKNFDFILVSHEDGKIYGFSKEKNMIYRCARAYKRENEHYITEWYVTENIGEEKSGVLQIENVVDPNYEIFTTLRDKFIA